MPFASKNVHSMPLLLLTKKRFLVQFMHYLFLDDTLFYTLRFFMFFFCHPSGSSTFSVSDRRSLLWGFHCIRLSFCLKPFCWRLNKVDALSENRSCRKGFHLISCNRESLLFSISRRRLSVSVYNSSHFGPYFFQLVVEKIIHQDLAVVKDCHPCVDRLVEQQPALAHVDSK